MTVARSGAPLLREWYQTCVPIAYICVRMQRGFNTSRGHQQRKNKGAHQKKYCQCDGFPPCGGWIARGGDLKGGGTFFGL